MLAPDDDTLDGPSTLVHEIMGFQRRDAYNGQHFDGHASCESSIEDDDMIDEPPTGNPIGPPIENFFNPPYEPEQPRRSKNLGRRGRLDELTKQGAKIMRLKRNCWPCRLLKYKVYCYRWTS